jgi:hypothetical protein
MDHDNSTNYEKDSLSLTGAVSMGTGVMWPAILNKQTVFDFKSPFVVSRLASNYETTQSVTSLCIPLCIGSYPFLQQL